MDKVRTFSSLGFGILLGIVMIRISFPQNLSLVILLLGTLFYFVETHKFYWLLPIAILAPPFALIKHLTVSEICIPVLFFGAILISMIKKVELPFKYIPLLVYAYFLIGLIHYLKNPSLPGYIFDPSAPYGIFRTYWCFFSQFMIYAIILYFFSEKRKQVSLIRILFILSLVIILVYTFLILTRSEILTLIPANARWDFFFLQSPGKFPLRADALRHFGLLLLQLVLVFGQNSKRRICRAALIGLSICAVLLSAARAALIAMCVSFLLFFFLTRKYRELVVSTLAGISIISILLISPHLKNHVPPQFQRLLVFLPAESRNVEFGREAAASSLWRMKVWEMGWEEVKKHPLIGTGYDVVRKGEGDIPDPESMIRISVKAGGLHNAYLSNLVIFGSFGLILFVSILLSHTYKAFKIFKYSEDPFIKQFHLWLLIVVISSTGSFWFEGGTTETIAMWLFFILGLINTNFKLSRMRGSCKTRD